ncbi:MAG: hypothetical protein GY767_14070 [Shimia sp.]|nr:hypothetical protein [Shimia sp.]
MPIPAGFCKVTFNVTPVGDDIRISNLKAVFDVAEWDGEPVMGFTVIYTLETVTLKLAEGLENVQRADATKGGE